MRPLSVRLQVIFDSVPNGARVADIGTDHAYLPIALSIADKCEKIIACDIKEKPLAKARENINKFHIKNIDTRLGNGLNPVKKSEVNTVIIAGMGGEVISEIIDSCPWAKDQSITFLLQPMTSAEQLRLYLFNNCFDITKETALIDQGKIYTVMSVKYTGEKICYKNGAQFIGKVKTDTEEGRLYILKQLNRINACLDDISKIQQKNREAEYFESAKKYIEKILEQ